MFYSFSYISGVDQKTILNCHCNLVDKNVTKVGLNRDPKTYATINPGVDQKPKKNCYVTVI